MTPAEAQILVAKLAAAYPRDWIGEATNAIYLERFKALRHHQAANEAIDRLIDSEPRLPSIARIREDYNRIRDRWDPPALAEPDVTEEQRDANIRRMGYMSDHLAGGDGHSTSFADCPHPGCSEIRDLSVTAPGQN